jgi:NAD(P)-dependent dehydrogenase (short-subunit alcohol dehydrogenase family)
VTIFGSARIGESHPAYAAAQETARRFAEAGFAVVTGGGGGVGRALALRFAGLGDRVVVAGRDEAALRATAAAGEAIEPVACDVTDEAAVGTALDGAEDAGPLRAVVHCAGRGGDRVRIIDRQRRPGPLETFEQVLRVNLVGTYNVLRLAAARMSGNEVVDGDRGAIVLTASVAAFDGQIGQTSYAASKAGVHGITLVAARDLASWAIRVNTIAPGVFDTPMLARLRDDIREGLAQSVPHPKRLGDPADYAHMAVGLLENGYVNGHTVRLDGAIRMAPR